MQTPSRTAGTAPHWRGPDGQTTTKLATWSGVAVGALCVAAGLSFLLLGPVWAGAVLWSIGTACLTVTALMAARLPGGALGRRRAFRDFTGSSGPMPRLRRHSAPALALTDPEDIADDITEAPSGSLDRFTGALVRPIVARHRPHPGDVDLYLDLDAVEVYAVYMLGCELFTHLRGGIGERKDPVTGDRRHIETSDVSLTWRCSCRRSARRLAVQLNEWEAKGTPLRLLAARGRCAVLMEDDRRWVVLPELKLAA